MATLVALPPFGWSQDALFQQWLKDDGDWVNAGMGLCVVQVGSNKRTLSAQEAGFLRIPQPAVVAGARLVRGQRLAVILGPGEGRDDLSVAPPPIPAAPTLLGQVGDQRMLDVARKSQPDRPRISPRARQMAVANEVDVSEIGGAAGETQRIVARDVQSLLKRERSGRTASRSGGGPCSGSVTLRAASAQGEPAAAKQLWTVVLQTLSRQAETARGSWMWSFAVWHEQQWRYSESPASDAAAADRQRGKCRQPAPPAQTTAIVYDVSPLRIEQFVPSLVPGCRLVVAVCGEPAVTGQRYGLRVTLVGDGQTVDGTWILQCLQAMADASAAAHATTKGGG